ncbi:MAG: DUF2812 domain-containing protein [Oscillibacter sp.]|nr:DUF2812 domain-containing protein [Oscillibacter sp.]
MRQKKRTIAPQEMWDPAAIEQWLEEEARRGWRITDCSGWFAKFKRVEPQECRMRVYPCDPEAKEAWQERIAVYEEMGWQFAVALGMDFEVYYCDDPTIPELDTDPEVFAMAWQEPLRKSWRYGWMLLAAMLAVVLIVLVSMLIVGETLLEYLLEAEFRMLFLLLVIMPVFTVLTVWRLRQIYQARKKLAAGIRHTTGDNWRRSRSRWRVSVVIVLAFWLGAWMADIFWMAVEQGPDTSGLPYVSTEQLAEGTENWEPDFSAYRRQCKPLRPVRSDERRFAYQGEMSVMNARSRLRFEWLAKALYQETKREFLKEHSAAEKQTVEHTAFDEAMLLRGEKEQMLLVRSGEVVYFLQVDFPADLLAHVDEIAAELA